MTRTVFDNSMVAHVWAQDTQENGRSGNGNLFFQGGTLYSYGQHCVLGLIAPGPLYLINTDSYSMTTNGKHRPAAWRAIDYGRGRFRNSAGVPGLGLYARVFQRIRCNVISKPEAVKELTRVMEMPDNFPGADSAEKILVSGGLSPSKAPARAKAIENRVERAKEKAAEKAARDKLNSEARGAKTLFAYDTPEKAARDTRDILSKVRHFSSSDYSRVLGEAKEESRDYYRAAKAAKAKGWNRIAAHCRACYKAARAEIKVYQDDVERYKERAFIRDVIKDIRAIPDIISETDSTLENPDTILDTAKRYLATTMNELRRVAMGFDRIADSRYARVALGQGAEKLRDYAESARELETQYKARKSEIVQEIQAAARAAWLAGGYPRHTGARLEDSEGGALLRADDVARDESGTITGGTLRTSWGATVPLTHAIRAFRFLKLCRDAGKPWHANGHVIRVGHFQVNSIDAHGNFRAACHRINWQEVERVARDLGVLDLPPADSALEPSRGAA